jgi:transcriptional regulator with PAS, ATPase and Fis domain
VVDTANTVLILGESGTGKELIARTLHFNSRRQAAPFVPINCAALPETLLESELFGHRKGAFPGATGDKKGLLEEADGGTLFLDEIGSMAMPVQSRLLRVLQDGEVKRVGDNTPSHVDVRVLAATNELLQARVSEGTFRKDLYYRLNVIPIELPSLRERREDIPVLVAHCLRNRVSPRTGCSFQITRRAVQALAAYAWPGNVRELENVIEHAMTLCEQDLIRVADLPQSIQENAPETSRVPPGDVDETRFIMVADPGQATSATSLDADPAQEAPDPGASGTASPERLRDFLRAQEVNHVNRMLSYTRGDKEKAAHLLGISLATLYRKLAGET